MAPDDGSVRITPREIYDTLTEVKLNVDLLVLGFDEIRRANTDHESRLRAVEKRVWAIPSAAALLAIASLVVSLLGLTGSSPSTANSTRTPVTSPSTQPSATAPVSPSPAVPVRAPEKTVSEPQSVSQSTPTTAPAAPAPTVPPVTVPTLPPVTVPEPVVTLAQRLEALARPVLSLTR